ncbi:putative RNA-directed DNA polymerase, eukaryota, reverse transcriptase zinc-binding domain protein [Tanacetum coccineum]
MTLNLLVLRKVKDNHMVIHKDMAADEQASVPPRLTTILENDLKGFSFIDEMNKMIEVGGALGYDVKAYKKYLRRLINGVVRSESERFGSTFSCGDATIFNLFIHDTGLIDLPMGARHFTWVNKVGSKMSKLDRFLILDNVLHSNTDLKKEISNGLRNHARRCLEPKDIKSSFLDFYKGKLSFYDSSVFFPPMLPAHRLSIVDREFLESMVSMVEIKATVWDCGSQKAPRPDGYSFMFIKNFWNRLKHDIQSFFGLFFSLLIVAKILANRLSKVIDSIISPEQYALITGRQILDGPLILKVPSYVLDRLGFGIKWRNRIKAGLTSARSSILINESPTSEFSLKRGLRQEDPLSPFLFIIIMEDLHMALNDGLAANMFHGVKVGSQGMHLSHLFYVDNDIIFSEWNLNAMENIIWILNIFYIASGLKIKIHRSNVYGVGVSSNEVDIMASYTGCEDGFFPFTYLGLPIGLIMSCITNWQPLIDRFKVRLSGWKANILSIGGCLILIKYVLSSLAPKTPRSLLGWCLFHNSNALWVHVVKTIHGDEAGIDIRGCHTNVDWSRPINVGRTKAEFDALISDIASLEPEKFVDSDTCIWSLSHDNKFSVNSVKKHIDELSLPSLSPNNCRRGVFKVKSNVKYLTFVIMTIYSNRRVGGSGSRYKIRSFVLRLYGCGRGVGRGGTGKVG